MTSGNPLHTFLGEIRAAEMAAVIDRSLLGAGSGFDYSGVTFPEEQEPDEERIPLDHVEVVDPSARLLLPKVDFLEALLQKAVEIQRGSNIAVDRTSLTASIDRLKLEIMRRKASK